MYPSIRTVVLLAPALVWAAAPVSSPLEILKQGLKEESAQKRTHAILAAGSLPPRQAMPMIAPALTDKDDSVRLAAVAAIGAMKTVQAKAKLREALEDSAPEVSFSAATTLWEMGDHSGAGILEDVLAGDRGVSPGFIGKNVRSAKSKLHNPSAMALFGAKQAAGILFGPAGYGITVVEGMRNDASAPARALSVKLLGESRDPMNIDALLGALDDKNWVVRTAAVRALGNFRRKDVTAAIEKTMEDKNDAVRYMAAASMLRVSPARK